MKAKNMTKDIMTPQETAEYMGYSAGSLAVMRVYNQGPKYFKERRYVYYRKADVDAWLKLKGKDVK